VLTKPWFIQQCTLRGKLIYEPMDNAHYESDDQAKSLKRIFARGHELGLVEIAFRSRAMSVFMLAAVGFHFHEYKPFLQALADNRLRLEEDISFNDVLERTTSDTGFKPKHSDIWFDFRNDVLWTLDSAKRDELVTRLAVIKQKWAAPKP